jgi:hypothetical protein
VRQGDGVETKSLTSDENNNKETLSGVKMATTTTTSQSSPEELVDLAQPITPLSMERWELELKDREKAVARLEKAVNSTE